MLKMFAENRGSYVCECNVTTEYNKPRVKGDVTFNGEKITGVSSHDGTVYNISTTSLANEFTITFYDNGLRNEDQKRYEFTIKDGKCHRDKRLV